MFLRFVVAGTFATLVDTDRLAYPAILSLINATNTMRDKKKFNRGVASSGVLFLRCDSIQKQWPYLFTEVHRIMCSIIGYVEANNCHRASRRSITLTAEFRRFLCKIHIKMQETSRKATHAAMLLERGQRSIEAWYFMFSICFFNASLSMVAIVLASIGCGDDSRRRLAEFCYWLKDGGKGNRIDLEFEKRLDSRPDKGLVCFIDCLGCIEINGHYSFIQEGLRTNDATLDANIFKSIISMLYEVPMSPKKGGIRR